MRAISSSRRRTRTRCDERASRTSKPTSRGKSTLSPGSIASTSGPTAETMPVRTCDGEVRSLALRPRSVADFYRELMATLRELGVETTIHPRPNELEDATPFTEDERHASYDPDAASRCWRVLVQA